VDGLPKETPTAIVRELGSHTREDSIVNDCTRNLVDGLPKETLNCNCKGA
jgi:hypothetical protein